MNKKIFLHGLLLFSTISASKYNHRNYSKDQLQQPAQQIKLVQVDRQVYQDNLEARIARLRAKNLRRAYRANNGQENRAGFEFNLARHSQHLGGLYTFATQALILTTMSALIPETEAFALCYMSKDKQTCENCFENCMQLCPERSSFVDWLYICQIVCV